MNLRLAKGKYEKVEQVPNKIAKYGELEINHIVYDCLRRQGLRVDVEFSVVFIVVVNVLCISRAMSVAFGDLKKLELFIYYVKVES